jgi:hypothetical protein
MKPLSAQARSVVYRLLHHSWSAIDYDYNGLTTEEKQLVGPEDFSEAQNELRFVVGDRVSAIDRIRERTGRGPGTDIIHAAPGDTGVVFDVDLRQRVWVRFNRTALSTMVSYQEIEPYDPGTPTVCMERWNARGRRVGQYTNPKTGEEIDAFTGTELAIGTIVKARRDVSPKIARVRKGDLGVVFARTGAYGDGGGPMVRWLRNGAICNVNPSMCKAIFAHDDSEL